jgi:hypothetical protein
MRVFLVITFLLVSGCASDAGGGISGKQSKNSGPVRYERLGAVTSIGVPDGLQCGTNKMKWCSVESRKESCQCLYIHQAEDKVRRMAGQLRNQRYSNHR